jgi:hypothetical protein
LNVRLGGPQNGHLPPCSAFENLNRFKYFLITLDRFPLHNVIESKNRILKSLKCKQQELNCFKFWTKCFTGAVYQSVYGYSSYLFIAFSIPCLCVSIACSCSWFSIYFVFVLVSISNWKTQHLGTEIHDKSKKQRFFLLFLHLFFWLISENLYNFRISNCKWTNQKPMTRTKEGEVFVCIHDFSSPRTQDASLSFEIIWFLISVILISRGSVAHVWGEILIFLQRYFLTAEKNHLH